MPPMREWIRSLDFLRFLLVLAMLFLLLWWAIWAIWGVNLDDLCCCNCNLSLFQVCPAKKGDCHAPSKPCATGSSSLLVGTGVLVIARSQLLYYVPMAFTKLVRFSSSVAFVLAALLLLWGPLAFLLLSRTKGSRCKACVTLSSISTKTNPKTSSTQSLYVSYQRGIVFSILVRMDFKQLIWSTKECCLNSLIVSLRLLVVEETVGFQCVYIRWVFEQQVIVCLVVVAHCSPLCNWSFFVFVNHFPTIWNQELFNLQTGWLVSCFVFQNWRLARDTVLKTRMCQNVLSCGKLLNDSFLLQKFQNSWCNFRKKPVVVCSFNANGFCSVQGILRIIIILQSCDTIIKARRVKTNNLLHLADFAGAYYSMSNPFNSTKKMLWEISLKHTIVAWHLTTTP